MSAPAGQIAFLCMASAWIALPWFVLHWRRQRGVCAAPDGISVEQAGWQAPARAFKAQVGQEFVRLLEVARDSGAVRGANQVGTPFLVLGLRDQLAQHLPPSAKRLRLVVIATRSLDVPAELVCERDLYAQSRAVVGAFAMVRGVFAHQEVVIGVRTRVTRWAHSDHRLEAAEGAILYGCASADQELMLAKRVRFERLIAPAIYFGKPDARYRDMGLQRLPFLPPDHVQCEPGRPWLVDGNLEVPAGRQVDADLIVTGHLVLQPDSRISGSVRVDKSVTLERRSCIDGSLVAEGDILLKDDSQVGGVIVGRKHLTMLARVYIGTQTKHASVVAKHIEVHESCVVHGSVWAQRSGKVATAPQRQRNLNG